MKKFVLSLLTLLVVFSGTLYAQSGTAPAQANIVGTNYMTENGYGVLQLCKLETDYSPLPMADGLVVWDEFDGHDYEIFASQNGLIVQLTHNEYDDHIPQTTKGMVAWSAFDGHDTEIFLWQNGVITQLTDNAYEDLCKGSGDGLIVWEGFDGHDYETFLWHNNIITQLTNNEYAISPAWGHKLINGAYLWLEWDGHDSELFMWQNGIITHLTNNEFEDTLDTVQVADNMVVWAGYDGKDYEIFLHQNGVITQLTDNMYHDYSPQTADGLVIWSGSDGHDQEIFLWQNGAITQITNNEYNDDYPQIDDGLVVWKYSIGLSEEIFCWQNGLITQLTTNKLSKRQIETAHGLIVWVEQPSWRFYNLMMWQNGTLTPLRVNAAGYGYYSFADNVIVWIESDGHDDEIFFWRDGTITQLTDNDYEENQIEIDNNSIVYIQWNGNTSYFFHCPDMIKPTIQLTTQNESEQWVLLPAVVKGSTIVRAIAQDNAGINPANWEYKLDGTVKPGTLTPENYYEIELLKGGVHTLSFSVTDIYRNIGQKEINVTVDLNDHSFPLITSSSTGGWQNASALPVNVSATATDVGSGLDPDSWCYQLNGTTGTWNPITGITGPAAPVSVSVSGEGETTVYFKVSDYAGNETIGSTIVRIDTAPPVFNNFTYLTAEGISLNEENGGSPWSNSDSLTVSTLADDTNGSLPTSGLDAIYWSPDNNLPLVQWQNGGTATLSAEGNTTLYFQAVDRAGNSRVAGRLVRLDRSGPDFNMGALADDYISHDLTFSSLPQALDELSGVVGNGNLAYSFTPSTGPWIPLPGATTGLIDTSTLDEGEYELYLQAVDALGNMGTSTAGLAFTIDRTAPVIQEVKIKSGDTWLAEGQYAPAATVEVVVTAVDTFGPSATAGQVAAYAWSLSSTPLTSPPLFDRVAANEPFLLAGLTDGVHYLYVAAIDEAGNRSTSYLERLIHVDASFPLTAPRVESLTHPAADSPEEAVPAKDAFFSFTPPATGLSGLAGYHYDLKQGTSLASALLINNGEINSATTLELLGLADNLGGEFYYLTVRMKSGNGRLSEPAVYPFRIDSTPPGVFTLSSSSHPLAAHYYPKSKADISWNRPQDFTGIRTFAYKASTSVFPSDPASPGWGFTTGQNLRLDLAAISGNKGGEIYIAVYAEDYAGNRRFASLSLRFDTLAPTIDNTDMLLIPGAAARSLSLLWNASTVSDNIGIQYGSLELARIVENTLIPLGEAVTFNPAEVTTYTFSGLDIVTDPVFVVTFLAKDLAGNESSVINGINLVTGEPIDVILAIPFTQKLGGYTVKGAYSPLPAQQSALVEIPAALRLKTGEDEPASLPLTNLNFSSEGELLFGEDPTLNYSLAIAGFFFNGTGLSFSKAGGLLLHSLTYTATVCNPADSSLSPRTFTYNNVSLSDPPAFQFIPAFLTANEPAFDFQTRLPAGEGETALPAWLLSEVHSSGFIGHSWQAAGGYLNLEPIKTKVTAYVLAGEEKDFRLPLSRLTISSLAVPGEGEISGGFYLEAAANQFKVHKALLRYNKLIILEAELWLHSGLSAGTITLTNFSIDLSGKLHEEAGFSSTPFSIAKDGRTYTIDRLAIVDGNLLASAGTISSDGAGLDFSGLQLTFDGLNYDLPASLTNFNGEFFGYQLRAPQGSLSSAGISFPAAYITLPACYGGGEHSLTGLVVAVAADQILEPGKGSVNLPITLDYQISGAASPAVTVGELSLSPAGLLASRLEVLLPPFLLPGVEKVELANLLLEATGSVGTTERATSPFTFFLSGFNLTADAYCFNGQEFEFEQLTLSLTSAYNPSTLYFTGLRAGADSILAGARLQESITFSASPWYFSLSSLLLDAGGLTGSAFLQLPEVLGGGGVEFSAFRVFPDGSYETGEAPGEFYLRFKEWLVKAGSLSFEDARVRLSGVTVFLYSAMGGGELVIPDLFLNSTGELESSGTGTLPVSFLSTNGFLVDASAYRFDSEGLLLSGKVHFPPALGENAGPDYQNLEIRLEPDGAILTPLTATPVTYYVGGWGVQAGNYQFDRDGLLIQENSLSVGNSGTVTISLPEMRFASDGRIKLGGKSPEGFTLSLFEGNIKLGVTEVLLNEEGLNLKAFVGLPPKLGLEYIYFDKLTLHPDGRITTDVVVPEFSFSLFNFRFLLRNIRFDENGFSIGEGIVRLPDSLGNKEMRLVNFRIASTGDFELGGVGMDPFSLWGYTFYLDNLGYSNGVFSFEGRVHFPENFFIPQLASQAILISNFKISSEGEVLDFALSLTGEYSFTLFEKWTVVIDTITIAKQYFSITEARLLLPPDLGLGAASVSVNGIVFDMERKTLSLTDGIAVNNLVLSYEELKLVVDSLNISRTEGLVFAGSLQLPSDLPLNLGGVEGSPNILTLTRFQIKPDFTVGDIDATLSLSSFPLLPDILSFNGSIGFNKTAGECFLSCTNGLFTFGSVMPGGIAGESLNLNNFLLNVTRKSLESLDAGITLSRELTLLDYLNLSGVTLRAYKATNMDGSSRVEFSVGATSLTINSSSLPESLRGLSVLNPNLTIDTSGNINFQARIVLPEDENRIIFGDVHLREGSLGINIAGKVFTLEAAGQLFLGSSFPEGIAGTSVIVLESNPLIFSNIGGLTSAHIIINLATTIQIGFLAFKDGVITINKQDGVNDFLLSVSGYFELPESLPLKSGGTNLKLTVNPFTISSRGEIKQLNIGVADFSANLFDVVRLEQGNISVTALSRDELLFSFSGHLILPSTLPGSFSSLPLTIGALEFSSKTGLRTFKASASAAIDIELFSAILLHFSAIGISGEGIQLSGNFSFKNGSLLPSEIINIGSVGFDNLEISWGGEIRNFNATLAAARLTLAGFKVDVNNLVFSESGVSLSTATLTLPESLESRQVVLRDAGFTWGGSFYGSVGLTTMEFEVAGFTMVMYSPSLDIGRQEMFFTRVAAKLPAFIGGLEIELNGITIDKEGIRLGGGTFAIPDFTIAGGLGFKNMYIGFGVDANKKTYFEGGGQVIIPGAGSFSVTVSFAKRSDVYPWGIKRLYFEYKIAGIGIQLGATPLYLNAIVGGVAFGPPDEMPRQLQGMFDSGMRLSLGVVIADSTGGDVFKGKAMLWIDITNWGVAFKAEATILKGMINAELIAALNKKGFYGYFGFEIVFAKGKIEFFIFPYKGRVEFSGRGEVQFGIPAHRFLCIQFRFFRRNIHWGLLPSDLWLPPIGAEFGLFSGDKRGFKAFIKIPVLGQVGVFVGKGEFTFGNVSRYELYTPFNTSLSPAFSPSMALAEDTSVSTAKAKPTAESRVLVMDKAFSKFHKDTKHFMVPGKKQPKNKKSIDNEIFSPSFAMASPSPLLNEGEEPPTGEEVERLVLSVAFAEGDPKVTAISPSGQRYGTDHPSVEVYRTEEGIALAILNPEPGEWQLEVTDLVHPDSYAAEALGITKAPSLSVSSPTAVGMEVTNSITVAGEAHVYNGTAPTVKLYLSGKRDSFLGKEAAELVLPANGTFSTTLDVSGLAEGEYFIFAGVREDELNPATQVYAPGSFLIRYHTPLLAPVQFVAADNGTGGIDLSFIDPNGERSQGYKLFCEDLSVDPSSTDPFEHAQEEFFLGSLTKITIPGFKSGHTIRLRVAALDAGNQPGESSAPLEVTIGAIKERKNEFSLTVEELNLDLPIGELYSGKIHFTSPAFSETLTAYDFLAGTVIDTAEGIQAGFPENRFAIQSGEIPFTLKASGNLAPGSYTILLRFTNLGNSEIMDELPINLTLSYPPVSLTEVVVPHDWNIIEETGVEIFGANFFAGTKVYLGTHELPLAPRNPAETNPLAANYLDPAYLKVVVPAFFGNLPAGKHLLRIVGPAGDELSREVTLCAPHYLVIGQKSATEIPAGSESTFFFTIQAEDRFIGTARFHLENIPAGWSVNLVTPFLSDGEMGTVSVTVPYTAPLGSYAFDLISDQGDILPLTVHVSATYPAPTIASLSELSGLAGSELTLYGYGFGSNGTVKLGTVTLPLLAYSSDSIKVEIPEGAVSGDVIVERSDSVLSNTHLFYVKSRTFSLYPAVKRVELQPGETATVRVQVLGYAQTVNLEVINGEADLSVQLSTSSILPNGELTLELIAGAGITNGTYPVRLTGHSGDLYKTIELEVWVGSAFTITTATLPAAMENCGYETRLATANAQGTVTFSLESGELPLGMALSPDGLLSGKTKAVGIRNWVVKATDNAAHVAIKELSLLVEESGWQLTDKDNGHSRYNPVRSPADSRTLWISELNSGTEEILVADRVVYVKATTKITGLDRATGRLLFTYPPETLPVNFTQWAYGLQTLFLLDSNGRLHALDARYGGLRWQRAGVSGFSLQADKLYIGENGGLSVLEAATGSLLSVNGAASLQSNELNGWFRNDFYKVNGESLLRLTGDTWLEVFNVGQASGTTGSSIINLAADNGHLALLSSTGTLFLLDAAFNLVAERRDLTGAIALGLSTEQLVVAYPDKLQVLTRPALTGLYQKSEVVGEFALALEKIFITSATQVSAFNRYNGGLIWQKAGHFTDLALAGEMVYVLDAAGRVTAFNGEDNLSPPHTILRTVPAAPDGEAGWFITQPVIELVATDVESYVVKSMYQANQLPEVAYTTTFGLEDGRHSLRYKSVDSHGYAEADKPAYFQVDSTPPRTVLELTGELSFGYYTSTVKLGLIALDEGSGIKEIRYQLDGGEWQNCYSELYLTSEGSHTISFHSKDYAGNREEIQTREIKIDLSLPVVTMHTHIEPGLGMVYLEATDSYPGIYRITYSLDFTSIHTYTGPLVFTQGGTHAFAYQAIDSAGRESGWQTATITVPPITESGWVENLSYHAPGLLRERRQNAETGNTGTPAALPAGSIEKKAEGKS